MTCVDGRGALCNRAGSSMDGKKTVTETYVTYSWNWVCDVTRTPVTAIIQHNGCTRYTQYTTSRQLLFAKGVNSSKEDYVYR